MGLAGEAMTGTDPQATRFRTAVTVGHRERGDRSVGAEKEMAVAPIDCKA